MLHPRRQWKRDMSFGGRIPWAVGLLICVTVVMSLVTALGDRHAAPLFQWVSLQPAACWHGQIWRLVTWPFVEPSPWSLIFSCLALYWFAVPLAQRWGSRRFLTGFFSTMLIAAIGTCVIALIDPEVMGSTHLGGWAMVTALVVGWGLTYPDTIVRIYFVLPIRGFWFAWGTVALTVIYCVYAGWAGLLPELIGEGVVLAWFYRSRLSRRWSTVQRSFQSSRPAPPRPGQRGVVVDLKSGRPKDDSEIN
jgi:membrane associated rhomboid family serine protease